MGVNDSTVAMSRVEASELYPTTSPGASTTTSVVHESTPQNKARTSKTAPASRRRYLRQISRVFQLVDSELESDAALSMGCDSEDTKSDNSRSSYSGVVRRGGVSDDQTRASSPASEPSDDALTRSTSPDRTSSRPYPKVQKKHKSNTQHVNHAQYSSHMKQGTHAQHKDDDRHNRKHLHKRNDQHRSSDNQQSNAEDKSAPFHDSSLNPRRLNKAESRVLAEATSSVLAGEPGRIPSKTTPSWLLPEKSIVQSSKEPIYTHSNLLDLLQLTSIETEQKLSHSSDADPEKIIGMAFERDDTTGNVPDITAFSNKRRGRELKRRALNIAKVATWIIGFVLPVFFIVLGILNASLKDRLYGSHYGTRIEEANKVAVSVWPILFAAVVAQSLKIFVRWKVERGMRLLTLEQLISSHSLASVIKQPLLLQTFNWVSLVLLCLWGLSPLAGQAVERMLYQNDFTNQTKISYINTLSTVPVPFDSTRAEEPIVFQYILYEGSKTTTGASELDVWNNVRIPSHKDDDKSSYSSLVGLSLLGVPQDDSLYPTSTFSVPYGYFAFDCLPLQNDTTLRTIQDQTPYHDWDDHPWQADPLKLIWMVIEWQPDNVTRSDGYMFFASYNPNASNESVTFLNCTFREETVQATIECDDGYDGCSVSSVQATSNNSAAKEPTLSYDFLNNFLSASSDQVSYYSYLLSPVLTFSLKNGANQDLSTVGTTELMSGLSLMINTFWQLSYAPEVIVNNTQGSSEDTSSIGAPIESITAETTYHDLTYGVSYVWIAILLFISIILLLLGVVGIFLDYHTIGPDFLGFASSLTRDNKYMKVDGGNSADGGAKRAKELGDLMVMLQDVQPESEVGKIALGTWDRDMSGRWLKLGRRYR